MFTGIVQAQCRVVEIGDDDGVRSLTVDLGPLAGGLELGASVANNGACLTASSIHGSHVTFEVIAETLDLTNLGGLVVGDTVNIERSLRFGDELGGHIVSGHVSGVATVDEIVADGANRTMWFAVDAARMPFLLWKGWVAVDGVSLTISRVDRDGNRFAVSLIPETLQRTSLGSVPVGGRVNIELDSQTQTIVATVHELLRDPGLRAQILGDA
jgi:riboflavin synthase